MKIAIPLAEGVLTLHFGHCQHFGLYDVDKDKGTIVGSEILPSPPHQPGLLPAWLHERGANMVIAGGMGMRAQDIFRSHGMEVIVGAPSAPPEEVIQSYLNGTLTAGDNLCDH
jgi:predicted Fe-Mo cluster-binding NifX family protein